MVTELKRYIEHLLLHAQAPISMLHHSGAESREE